MERAKRLKAFDESMEEIKRNLENRAKTGIKMSFSDEHGDYVKQCSSEGRINVSWISGKENVADIMTKPLTLPPFKYLKGKLMGE